MSTLAADGTILASVSRHCELPTGERCSGGPAAPPDTLTVISISGDLDHDTAPLVSMALTSAINGSPRVCCDLTRVGFLGAAGVNTVLAAHHHASAKGRRFSVRGAQGITRQVLEITGMTRVLVLEP